MRKFASFLALLATGFSLCTLPNIARFEKEFGAVNTSVSLETYLLENFQRGKFDIVYGATRNLCKKGVNIVNDAFKLLLLQKLGEKLELIKEKRLNIYFQLADLAIGSIIEAFSPTALSYSSCKKIMRESIRYGLGKASEEDCEALEKAASIYYGYSFSDYLVDVCTGRNTPAEVSRIILSISGKIKGAEAVTELEKGVEENLTRVLAPELYKDYLEGGKERVMERALNKVKFPCSYALSDYVKKLHELKERGEYGEFLLLYSALKDMQENCVLSSKKELTATFSSGENRSSRIEVLKKALYGFESGSKIFAFVRALINVNGTGEYLVPLDAVVISPSIPTEGSFLRIKSKGRKSAEITYYTPVMELSKVCNGGIYIEMRNTWENNLEDFPVEVRCGQKVLRFRINLKPGETFRFSRQMLNGTGVIYLGAPKRIYYLPEKREFLAENYEQIVERVYESPSQGGRGFLALAFGLAFLTYLGVVIYEKTRRRGSATSDSGDELQL